MFYNSRPLIDVLDLSFYFYLPLMVWAACYIPTYAGYTHGVPVEAVNDHFGGLIFTLSM